jgi:excinuclease UvrABC nuclease subunit
MSKTTTPTCNWPGKSGNSYTHYVYPIGTKFADKPGNYVFCKKNAAGNWTPQYIGQAKNLNERLGTHEKEACAIARGATHIHAHLNALKADRLAEEKDLIQNFNPPCNEQLVA